MQYLNDDMDELFERAGNNYPLDKGKGDWESISKKLAAKDTIPEALVPLKNNKNKKIAALILLLFMLPAGWLLLRNTPVKNNLTTNNFSIKKITGIPAGEITRSYTNIRSGKATGINIPPAINENNNYANGAIVLPGKSATKIKISNGNIADIENDKYNEDDHEHKIDPVFTNNDLLNSLFSTFQNLKKLSDIKQAADLQTTINPLVIKSMKDITSNKKNNKADKNSEKGFYAGIIAGPDYSKVKSMKFDHTGVIAGLIIGLNVSAKTSIETGVSWNNKFYSSQGSNFNMDKIRPAMPSGMVINTLAAHSSLIEIPVKIKYNFINKNKSALFVTAGASAYIMTHEKNSYTVTTAGNTSLFEGVYTDNNYRLPAVVNFSVGYQYNISKNIQARVEPYLKLPVMGMGVGSLPITSAGLQLGIIKQLR